MPFFLLSCFVFAVSILIGQLPVASADCANFTYIYYAVDVPFGFYTRFKQKLDFVSCKLLLPNLPRSFNDSNASSVDREEDTSYIFNQSNDVSDSESIFKLIADYSGMALKIEAASTWALMALGVLDTMVL
jgi:hypothetical protein